MKYCIECGKKLEKRLLKNEGMIPYCPYCQEFRFPIFNTAVSMIVFNPTKDKILLIQQYGNPFNILVAGYVNHKENAESAVVREVKEEVGLNVEILSFNKSEYFEKSNTLIFNFVCLAEQEEFFLTDEVDAAHWFSIEDAIHEIKPNSLAQKFLMYYLKK